MFGKDDLLTDAQLHELLKDNGYTLAVLKGAKEVYSDLISEHAFQVLKFGGVKTRYRGKAPYIINRTKTGMCPMETLVMDAASPEEGAARLIEFFEGLKEKQNGTEKNERH